MMDFIEQYKELLMYISIPITSALVGWGTNVLAIKMTFYPVEFFGIKPIGWQGIIPSKAAKMSEKSVDLWLEKLINLQELFAQIDPKVVADQMKPEFDKLAEEIMNDVMTNQAPGVWERIPLRVKQMTYNRIARDMPKVVTEIMEDVKHNITDVFDIKTMVVERLTKDKWLLNKIFIECGKEEFKFIERSGLYFGFLFGLVQMAVWYFFQEWWLLPLFGLIVGYATNWLALKLIFEPVEEKKILGIKFQGLFIKRQNEVSSEYAKMLAYEIFTFDRVFAAIIGGPTKERFTSMIAEHANQAIEDGVGISKPIVNLVAGKRNYERMKSIVVEKTVAEMPKAVSPAFSYAEEAMDLENTFRTKMIALSPAEFVNFLRPVFQEDELKLIMVGAVLGMAAGFGQLFFVFGGI